MSDSPRDLEPDTLWARLQDATIRALQSGALQPIPTDSHAVQEGEFRFLARVVRSLERKHLAQSSDAPDNPFLPYDPAMFVADLSSTHVGLLNKFNVVEHHLLLCTRRFEHQECLLTEADFQAAWIALAEIPGLIFYNAGTVSGASQPHKHLQLVPLPMAPGEPDLPIQPAIDALPRTEGLHRSPLLPFEHRLACVMEDRDIRPLYLEMLDELDCAPEGAADCPRTGPYNLLLTRDWLLLVPRRVEHFNGVSFNALAFAGSFFVRSMDQLETLRSRGFLTALQHVVSRPAGGIPL